MVNVSWYCQKLCQNRAQLRGYQSLLLDFFFISLKCLTQEMVLLSTQKKWNNPPTDLINFVCCSVNGENIQSLMSSATFEITVTWRQWHYTTQHRWLRFWQPLGRLAILRISAVVWPYKNSLELYHKTVQENWKKSLIPSTNRAMRSRNKQNMLFVDSSIFK